MKPIHKFNGSRGATLCHKCSVIISEGLTKELYCDKCKPKQETLEEAARKYANITHNRTLNEEERYYKDYQKYDGFIDGYKLAQKTHYSEEDMREMYNKSCGLIGLGELDDQSENDKRFRELISEFKKK